MMARFLYKLREGEGCAFLSDGRICIVHPERPPFIKNADGSDTAIDITRLDPKVVPSVTYMLVGEGTRVSRSFRRSP